jgi:hypothetical protein
MKNQTPGKIMEYFASIVGGVIIIFYVVIFIGEGIMGPYPIFTTHVRMHGLILYCLQFAAVAGLILAFWKPAPGGILAVMGSLAIIVLGYLKRHSFGEPGAQIVFYLLFAAGVLHIISGALKKTAAPQAQPVEEAPEVPDQADHT